MGACDVAWMGSHDWVGKWGGGEPIRLSMWLIAGHFLWQYVFTIFPLFPIFLNGIGWDLRRPPTRSDGCWSGSLASGIPVSRYCWRGWGWLLPYSIHTHMLVSIVFAISWRGNQSVSSACIRIPCQSVHEKFRCCWRS